ncbi:MAG: 3-dehydroquinate synthase [Alphaproteobacteria bacterium]
MNKQTAVDQIVVDKITVGLGARGYDIVVGRDLLAAAGERLVALAGGVPLTIISDSTVAGLHLATLTDSLDRAGLAWRALTVAPGEEAKSFARLETLVEDVLDLGIERSSTLIALGGGVIGDLVGLAASLALRGIEYVQIPTTLLAQVDSAVGGKTAINSRHGKNLIGSFHQPRLVLADIGVLDTLARRELLAGYAEVVKYGLMGDAEFFAWLEANGAAIIDGDDDARRHAVLTSCRAKAAIVAEDEREEGARALLNLGHTFAHALEVETAYSDTLLHGEAVAIGLVMAFDLSARLGLCPDADAARVRRHLAAVGLPTDLRSGALGRHGWNVDALIGHMQRDKKVKGGKVTFVLASGIGHAVIRRDVEADAVRACFAEAA